MALPKSEVPLYDVSLPSSGEKIKIRPFTVKEEKILLLALASDNELEREQATKQVINNCIVHPQVEVDKLATYDIEYLFLQLRARSVGETLTLKFKPIEKSECKTCCKPRSIPVDLLAVKVQKDDNHKNKIQLNQSLGVIMREPNFAMMKDINKIRSTQDFNEILSVMAKCIEKIYDSKNTYDHKDHSITEFVEFLESLTKKEFEKLDQFFETLPVLKHVVNIDCEECGFHQEYALEGLEDFLA